MIHLQKFSTLIDLLTYFKSEQVCIDYLEILRWPNGMTCAYKECGHDKISKYSNAKEYVNGNNCKQVEKKSTYEFERELFIWVE